MADEPQQTEAAVPPASAPAKPDTGAARKARKSDASKKPAAKRPKKAEKKTGKTRRSARKVRETEMERELTFEIEHLRSLACQITTRYLEGLESEIVQIREAVMASRGHAGRLGRLETMLHAFQGLKVKPDKGRRKDLQRISDLVALLNRLAQKL